MMLCNAHMMYTVKLSLFETIDKLFVVLITGVAKISLTSARNLRIKSCNPFNSFNIFSGLRKGASLVPICSIIYSG